MFGMCAKCHSDPCKCSAVKPKFHSTGLTSSEVRAKIDASAISASTIMAGSISADSLKLEADAADKRNFLRAKIIGIKTEIDAGRLGLDTAEREIYDLTGVIPKIEVKSHVAHGGMVSYSSTILNLDEILDKALSRGVNDNPKKPEFVPSWEKEEDEMEPIVMSKPNSAKVTDSDLSDSVEDVTTTQSIEKVRLLLCSAVNKHIVNGNTEAAKDILDMTTSEFLQLIEMENK